MKNKSVIDFLCPLLAGALTFDFLYSLIHGKPDYISATLGLVNLAIYAIDYWKKN